MSQCQSSRSLSRRFVFVYTPPGHTVRYHQPTNQCQLGKVVLVRAPLDKITLMWVNHVSLWGIPRSDGGITSLARVESLSKERYMP